MAETTTSRVNIQQEAREAIRVIAEAAAEATKVVSTATAEALRVANAKGADDHDLLIKISTLMGVIQTDILEIKTGTATKIDDHEARLKKLENKQSSYFITLSIYTIATGAMIVLFIKHLIIN